MLVPSTSHLGNFSFLLSYLASFVICLVQVGHSSGWLADDEASSALFLGMTLVIPIALAATLQFLVQLLAATLCWCTRCTRTQALDKACNVDLNLVGPGQEWSLQIPAKCEVPVCELVLTVPANPHAMSDVNSLLTEVEESRPHLEFQILDYVAKVGPLEAPIAVLLGAGCDGDEHHSEIVYPDEDMHQICQNFAVHFGHEIADVVAKMVLDILRQQTKPRQILVLVVALGPGGDDSD